MKLIQLTNGKSTKVDNQDFVKHNMFKWRSSKQGRTKGYFIASREIKENGKSVQLKLHRVIVGAKKGQYVDHINQDSLDNRRENLRICTNSENLRNRGKQSNNTSGFKGVSWNKNANKFSVRISVNGNDRFYGYFSDAKKAARVYNSLAKKLHGEFAYLNKI